MSSTAPAVSGWPKSETQTSSKAFDSRGASVNVWTDGAQAPMKQR